MSKQTLFKRVQLRRTPKYLGLCLFFVVVLFLSFLTTLVTSLLPSSNPISTTRSASAATSSNLNYQARLLSANGNIVPDGYYNIEFKLYNASSGGTALWSEAYYDSNGVAAGNDNRVRVVNGYLSVNLGSQTAFPSMNWDQDMWLTMNVGGSTQTATPTYDGEMTPRIKLTAVPYAFQAKSAEGLNELQGSYTGTLDFTTLTANRAILLPDAAGTVCLQSSSACGFATSSGSGNYIQNGTSPQTADFNITGNGTIGGTLTLNGDLLMGTGDQIDFANEIGDKEYYYDNTYGRGIESGTLTDWTGSRYRLRIGGTSASTGTERLSVTTTGLKIGTGDATQALDVTGNGLFSGTITGTTLNGTTGINSGAGAGTQRIDASGNLVNIGTITSGLINGQTISSAANFTGTVAVTGNVGIGVAPGTSPLHVKAANADLFVEATTTTTTTVGNKDSRLFLQNYSTTVDAGAEVLLGAVADTATGRYVSIGTDIKGNSLGDANGDFYIATKTSTTDTALTRRLVVQANGNVGIGDTTPASLFTVGNGDPFQINSSGTITAGTWNGTALTDAYVSDTLTSSLFVGSGSTTTAVDLATAEVAGTLADGNVSDTLTIGASGSVTWTALTGYPSACAAGSAVSTIGDTNTCTAFNTDTSLTLQDSYDADADGSDATIGLTAADDSFVVQNPASGGTDSGFAFKIDQLSTGAVEGLRIESAGTGNLLTIRDTTATARDVLTIANGGATTFRNQANSTAAFEIQNAAGTNSVFVVNTLGDEIDIWGTLYVNEDLIVQDNLTVSVGSINVASNNINVTRSFTTNNAYLSWVGANAFPSWNVLANGKTEWGSGTAALDTNLYRSGVNALTTDGALTVTGAITSGLINGQTISSAANFTGTVAVTTLGSAGSTSVCRNGSNQIATCSANANGVTLQQAYDADADGSDAIVALTAADDSFVIQNPASGGTDSTFAFKIDQLATGAVEGLRIESAGTGNLLTVRDTTATAVDVLTITNGGATTFRNQTDSTSAFRIQDAAGTSIIRVDTVDKELVVDAGSSAGVALYVIGTSSPGISLQTLELGNVDGAGNWSNVSTVNDAVVRANSEDLILAARNATGVIRFTTGATDTEKMTLTSAGQLQLAVQGNTGGLLIGTDTNLYRSNTNELKTDDSLVVAANLNVNGNTTLGDAVTDGITLQGQTTAAGSATGTTRTTEAIARTNVTTVTVTSAGFANNDVIRINNAGQDYYTRIVSGGGTTALTISPAVSYDASVTVEKYNIQNIGATTTDYTTEANRFFQGYFLGGVVTGAGSTTLSDGNLSSTNALNFGAPSFNFKNTSDSTNAFQIQNAAGTSNLFVADTTNTRLAIGASPANSLLTVGTNTTTASGGITFGTDTNLYRSNANELKTDDSLVVAGGRVTIADGNITKSVGNAFSVNSSLESVSTFVANAGTANQIIMGANGLGTSAGLAFGSGQDTNLYRSAGDTLKTDDALIVTGNLTNNGSALFQNSSNSTTAFQIQNAAGASLFNVDSSYSNITLNGNNSGETAAWQTNANALPAVRTDQTTVTANGYVYVIGGYNGSAVQSTVYYAKLNADGSAGAWQTNANALPAVRRAHASVSANGYIYVIGGFNGTANQSTVYYAKLNADGSTGTWSTNVNALPVASAAFSAVTANGYVYIMGGSSGGGQSTVYYAKLNADGSTGTWTTSANSLPAVRERYSTVVANGYVYVIGGKAGAGSAQSTVYYAKLNADGSTGTWSTNVNALPTILYAHNSVVLNGYVYVIGGYTGTSHVSTVYYAKLNADGSTGTWSTNVNALPATRAQGTGIAVNGYIYMIGGDNTGGTYSTVYYASTSRIKLGGSLDLVGLSGHNLSDGDGGQGGSLTAGNTNIVGAFQVQGAATFNQMVTVNNNFSVASISQVQNVAPPALFSADSTNQTISIYGGKPTQLGTWALSNNSYPVATYGPATAAGDNGYIYGLGGITTGYVANTYYAKLNADGTHGAWTATTALPAARFGGRAVVNNGYIYMVGGSSAGGVYASTVYYAPLNTDGTIGTWSTTTALPATVHFQALSVANGYMYSIGGSNAAYTNAVYRAPINSDGTVGAWTASSSIIGNLSNIQSITDNKHIYVFGGFTGTGSVNTVQSASINADGSLGTWTTTTALPTVNRLYSVVTLNGYVYILGGYDPLYKNEVSFAKLNGDGTVGAWSTGTNPLPDNNGYSGAVAVNGFVYSIAGHNGSAVQSKEYISSQARLAIGGNVQIGGVDDSSPDGGSLTVNGNIVSSCTGSTNCASSGYLGLFVQRGSLGAPYATLNYPTIKTDHGAVYFAVSGDTYAGYVNSAGFNNISDKTKKENYTTLDYQDVLNKIDDLSIEQYNYKSDDPSVIHIGAYAQDFHALFGLNGTDNTAINVGDQIGVTMAGVKALSAKVNTINATLQTGSLANLDIDGSSNLSSLVVSGSASLGGLNVSGPAELSSLLVTGDVEIQGSLKVASIEVGTIKVGGHIVTAGDTPTGQVLEASGTGAVYTIDGNDTAGTITITAGSDAIAVGELMKVTFKNPFGKAPRVILSAQDDASMGARIFPSSKTSNDYMLKTGQALTAGKTYTFDYFVVE